MEETKAAKGKRARRKGHQFERDMASLFTETLDFHCKRGLQSRDGAEAPDVIVPGLHIECKKGLKTNIRAALKQAREASRDGNKPVAICQDDRQEATVTMFLEDFMDLLKEKWNFNT